MEKTSTVTFCRTGRRAMPRAEVALWQALRGKRLNGHRFRRQHPIGPWIADFACIRARLVIEVDGPSHFTEAGRAHDARRTRDLKRAGWHVIRFTNDAILNNLPEALNQIQRHLPQAR